MPNYLTPEIAEAIPMLDRTCEELTRQALTRALTEKTKEWCIGDPELAEWLTEGKKTLEGCIKYVMDQAFNTVAKNVAAMPDAEVKMLPTRMINGKKATGAGGCVGDDQAYQWAHDYYYKVKETTPNGRKGKTGKPAETKSGGKTAAKGKKTDAAPKPETVSQAAAPAQKTDVAVKEGEYQQMMLGKSAA